MTETTAIPQIPSTKYCSVSGYWDTIHISAGNSAGPNVFQLNLELNGKQAVAQCRMTAQLCKELLACNHTSTVSCCVMFLKQYLSKQHAQTAASPSPAFPAGISVNRSWSLLQTQNIGEIVPSRSEKSRKCFWNCFSFFYDPALNSSLHW